MAKEDAIRLELPENPTLAVEVGDRTLHLELGNMTYALECKKWVDELGAAEDGDYETIQRIADEGADIVSSAFTETDAADVLVGGRDRLNIVRIMDVIKFILEHTTSTASMRVMQDAVDAFSATGDED